MLTETSHEHKTGRSRRILAAPPLDASPLLDKVAGLRTIPQLEGLTDEEYCWIARHATERLGADGSLIFRENEPSHHLNLILSGEVYVHRQKSGPVALYMGRTGQVTGRLPYSRMKTWGGDGCASGLVWVLDIHEDLFPAMLAAIPSMTQRCVSVLLDRVREFTRADEQAAKLAAMGKLAANLAHELNNPASAARSAATAIASARGDEDEAKYLLGRCASEAELAFCREWMRDALLLLAAGPALSVPSPLLASLDAGDREDQMFAWLEAHQVPQAWSIAPTLAETTLPIEQLQLLAAQVCNEALTLAVTDFAGALRLQRTADTIVASTARIFDIVTAIKDYSYMDQAPIQDVNLAQSLDTTLAMLQSRLKRVSVERVYATHLPPLRAFGSELNQVWTVILENALDAMSDRGTLKLKTALKAQTAVVEIWDNGPGIDPALQDRIFEPFFTTRPIGSGLGLGLDMAQRIVAKHFGSIKVESKPGSTCFQVRLPLDRTEVY